MSFFKKLALAVVPVAVGAITNTEVGAVATGIMGAAGGAKWLGKKYEAAGGRSLHKSGTPLVAAGTSLALGQFMSPEALTEICTVLQQVMEFVCAHPRTLGPLAVVATVVSSHGGVSDLFKSAGRKTS